MVRRRWCARRSHRSARQLAAQAQVAASRRLEAPVIAAARRRRRCDRGRAAAGEGEAGIGTGGFAFAADAGDAGAGADGPGLAGAVDVDDAGAGADGPGLPRMAVPVTRVPEQAGPASPGPPTQVTPVRDLTGLASPRGAGGAADAGWCRSRSAQWRHGGDRRDGSDRRDTRTRRCARRRPRTGGGDEPDGGAGPEGDWIAGMTVGAVGVVRGAERPRPAAPNASEASSAGPGWPLRRSQGPRRWRRTPTPSTSMSVDLRPAVDSRASPARRRRAGCGSTSPPSRADFRRSASRIRLTDQFLSRPPTSTGERQGPAPRRSDVPRRRQPLRDPCTPRRARVATARRVRGRCPRGTRRNLIP